MEQVSFFDEFSSLINPKPAKVRERGGSAKKPHEKRAPGEPAGPPKEPKSKFPIYPQPCSGCPLEPYKKLLDVRGNLATCKLVVILDRPSLQHTATGHPFIGPDFDFLEKALQGIGLAPTEVAYINSLRCACHDKEIEKEEILRCGNYIARDLAASSCQVVLCCSAIGIRYMFGAKSLKTYRGRVAEFNKKKVVVCQSLELVRRDPVQASLFENDIKRLGQVLVGNYSQPEFKYLSLTNPDEIVSICEHLVTIYKPEDLLGWDIETMWLRSLEPYAVDCYAEQFRIWQMAFAWDDFTAVGFPFDPDPGLVAKYGLPSIHSHPEIFNAVRKVLESCKVVEHTKFDARGIRGKYGIELAKNLPLQQFEDLHAMNFLINPEDIGGNSLKHLAWEYTQEGGYEEGIGFVETIEEYDWEPNVHYNCHDADLTRRIKGSVRPKMVEMKQDRVYELLLKPINCAALEMELDGFQMDRPYLVGQQEARKEEMAASLVQFRAFPEITQFIEHCSQMRAQIALEDVKGNPKKQREQKAKMERYFASKPEDVEIKDTDLTILLYEVIKIPVTKVTEENKPSTDADILEANKKKHPILAQVLAYKKAQKLYSTYISPYLDPKLSKGKDPKLERLPHIKFDGRVHPTIKPTGAATGRSSCENPNGQNIKNEYEAKRPFISRFENGILVASDYSQAEIRMAAVQCKDPVLTKALAYDIHTINLAVIEKIITAKEAKIALTSGDEAGLALSQTCKQGLAVLFKERVKEEKELKFYEKIRRTIAKKFMFGPMYGQSEWGIVRQLVTEVGMKEVEAKRDAPIFLAALRELYSQYFAWASTNVPEAKKQNYVESVFGRRRPLNYAALLANLSANDKDIKRQLSGLDRKVTNTKVQGPASDLNLLAGVHLVELFKNKRLSPMTELREKFIEDALNGKFYAGCLEQGLVQEEEFENFIRNMLKGEVLSRTILPIHDSLITDCPYGEVIPVAIMVDAVMSNTPRYYLDTNGVPFGCELEIGPNLGEMKSLSI